MKKLALLAILAIGMAFTYSCEKEDDAGNTGGTSTPQYKVRFVCDSNNPYKLWVDGTSQGTVNGKSYKIANLIEGYHTWNVEQESGYVLYPTTKEGTFNLTNEIIITFP